MEYKTPAFLENRSADDFWQQILEFMPPDIDLSEGGHGWNHTRPVALIGAYICEFIMPEVLKLALPDFSYGQFLEGHGKSRHIYRRAATAATGEITITGAVGTTIPAGSIFATASVHDEPSVDYRTTEEAIIPDGGAVIVPVECTQTGIVGNTGKSTVILVGSKLTGITAVTNEEPITGGVEEETDEILIARILEYDRTQGEQFVGNMADYKRWATSVPGVGEATVIPAQDDSGLVTIVLTDMNGAAATDLLCEQVYNHIMRPENPYERLAPVNAFLSVVPPATIGIAVKATVELVDDATIESVSRAFLERLALYMPVAMDEGEVKLTRVGSELSKTAGVNDYRNLQIGRIVDGEAAFDTINIPVSNLELPEITAEGLYIDAGNVV